MNKLQKNKMAIEMQNLQLDEEEKELLDAFEKGKCKTVSNFEEELAQAKEAATNSLSKDARINIRMSSVDLEHIKRKAVYEGLPYQTLIASVLHKYAAGHLQEASAR